MILYTLMTLNCCCRFFIQVSSTFDMIGYPKWVEDTEALDKYYENVSDIQKVFHCLSN